IWLARRQIDISQDQQERLFQSFLDGLKKGRIVLLMDSYDELSRMDLQLEMFRRLLGVAKLYVGATRPEMYIASPEHHVLRIRSTWDIQTIRSYLAQIFADTPSLANDLAVYIANRDKIGWLRNPRYLHLLGSILHSRMRSGDQFIRDIFAVIEQGQYQL